MKQDLPVLIIAGPTCSGKSSLAIKLAKDLDGEVINIDAVQAYQGFDIGSAKIGQRERNEVPHHLIDIALPNETLDAFQFAKKARSIIAEVLSRGKLAILVGGTNLLS